MSIVLNFLSHIKKSFFNLWGWLSRITNRFSGRLTIVLALAAVASCLATYFALVKSGTFEDKANKVLPLIYLDLILLLGLMAVIGKRLYELWREHKQGLAGSRLHIRLVLLFGGVAITPAILVAVFSLLFFNVGVKAWFSEPVKEALKEASNVAEAYVHENQNAIRHDAASIVSELRPQVPMLITDKENFSEILSDEVDRRGLGEAIVFDTNQRVVAKSYLTFALEFEKILIEDFKRAKQGELVIRTSERGDRVRALVRLDPVTETYLFIGKFVDPQVLGHLNKTKGAVSEYKRLDEQRSGIHLTFIAFFTLVALILLLAAMWVGLSLAHFLVQPLKKLITAADAVRHGNLSVSVTDVSEEHEIGHLAEAFNRMISQLYRQRQELVSTNEELIHRRQFMESVLQGVSAGVMGVGKDLHVNLMNRRAQELLSIKEDITDTHLSYLSPELFALMEKVKGQDPVFEQVSVERRGRVRILQACIVPELSQNKKKHEPEGFVITFDDITTLVSAQRKAAWSDVARKIAHEIKNPLTPIQLSAERLKRKYLKEIQSDPETFQGCIDTIIRQVAQIGKLVSEFSSFARMPEPDLRDEDMNKLISEAVFLQKQAHTDVSIETTLPSSTITFRCDAQQISQMLTNLLQNALDALEAQKDKKIFVSLSTKMDEILLMISDNGPGFPVQDRERLLEPYVTLRAKGTGLGLAIVAKIIEDHGGVLELSSSPMGGAAVVIRFSKNVKALA